MRLINDIRVFFLARTLNRAFGKISKYGEVYQLIPTVIKYKTEVLKQWKEVEKKSMVKRLDRYKDLSLLKSSRSITDEELTEWRELRLFMSATAKLAKTAAIVGMLSGQDMIDFSESFSLLNNKLMEVNEKMKEEDAGKLSDDEMYKIIFDNGKVIKDCLKELKASAKRMHGTLHSAFIRSNKETVLNEKEVESLVRGIQEKEMDMFENLIKLNENSKNKLVELIKLVQASI